MHSKTMPMKDLLSLGNLAWWVACTIYVFKLLMILEIFLNHCVLMNHFLVHYVLCKIIGDRGTLECVCLFVWEDCSFNLHCCRLTLHVFLSLKELKFVPTMTSWLLDQNLQSWLRWFPFSPCFSFFLANIWIMWIFSTSFFEHPCSIHIVAISP